MTGDIYGLPLYESRLFHIITIHKDDPATVVDSAIPIIQSVDRGVELVMTANGRQHVLARLNRQWLDRINCEFRLSGLCSEFATISRRIWKIKSPLSNSFIEALKTGNDVFNLSPNEAIIGSPFFPGKR